MSTLPEFIYSTYTELLSAGWRMKEINESDLWGFQQIKSRAIRHEKQKTAPVHATIDAV